MWSRLLIAVCACACGMTANGAEIVFVGTQRLDSLHSITVGPLTPHSDTITIGGKVLERGSDYVIDYDFGKVSFSASVISQTDSVHITWLPMISVLGLSGGREIPFDLKANRTGNHILSAVQIPSTVDKTAGAGSIQIHGSKSFRVSGGTGSIESNFGQSLDLSIAGNLTPSVTMQGAISDRPDVSGYGTFNSRLNEIDRVRMTITAPHFRVDVGDVLPVRKSQYQTTTGRVSGVSASMQYGRLTSSAMAARSKGVYQSSRIRTIDGIQGPYRVAANAAAQAIVPGSESVWRDGVRLENNRDYTIDYPAGTIAFSTRVPIDVHSRIVVDFESQQTLYRRNLVAGSLGIESRDTTRFFSIDARDERDSKNEFLFAEQSQEANQRLDSLGDAGVVALSSVRSDSTGSYHIIADSLPDTVLVYVGTGNGDVSAQFTFVGEQQGRYVYVGNNEYRFAGNKNGEYDPVVVYAPATSLSMISVAGGTAISGIGRVRLRLQQSHSDRNLFSSRDDADNRGHFAAIEHSQQWMRGGSQGYVSGSVSYREKRFRSSDRRTAPDASYRFLLPESYDTLANQVHGNIDSRIPIASRVALLGGASVVSVDRLFASIRTLSGADMRLADNLSLRYQFTLQDMAPKDNDTVPESKGRIHELRTSYHVIDSMTFSAEGEIETRRTVNASARTGRDAVRTKLSLSGYSTTLYVEHRAADSLNGTWFHDSERWRIGGDSRRTFGKVDSDIAISWQRQRQHDGIVQSLGITSRLNYRDHMRRQQASYALVVSDEQRHQKGLTWLDVGEGLGGYRLENGEYIADPTGRYVLTEEVLSGLSRVRRIDRAAAFSREWKQWGVRGNSRVSEEVLTNKIWSGEWLLPFVTNPSASRQFLDRTYDATVHAFPIDDSYRMQVKGFDLNQTRQTSDVVRNRTDRRLVVTVRQPLGSMLVSAEREDFRLRSSSWYSGSSASGFKMSLSCRLRVRQSEYGVELRYRIATGNAYEQSKIVSLIPKANFQRPSFGNIRAEIELYLQDLTEQTVSYTLTDGHQGKRGAMWMLEANAGLTHTMKLSARISGRHADVSRPRIQARSELVASF